MSVHFILPKQVSTALTVLTKGGFSAFLIGGCVRDFLLGFAPKDFDITTNAKPKEILSLFSDYKTIETGLQHGTVTVLIEHLPIEITTYRIDGVSKDHRHPDCVQFSSSLQEDLARRDFTINAIAYSPEEGIIDLYDGQKDLQNGIIRCIGNAQTRFSEDALRILRALRFASVLGFSIEIKTSNALFSQKSLLNEISMERIAAEFLKLLCGKNIQEILFSYVEILGVILPEILPMKGFLQHNPHHKYDVWTHTAIAVDACAPLPHLRLAALLHDIGKPFCYSTDANGIGHFYGHAKRSTELACSILTRLRLDNQLKSRVLSLIKYHDTPIPLEEKYIKRWLLRLGAEQFFDLLALQRADNLAQSEAYFYRQKTFEEISSCAKQLLQKNACFSLKNLHLSGHDLLSLGIAQGPEIGKLLLLALNAVIDEEVPNEKQALLAFVEKSRS